METPRTLASRSEALWTTAALSQARHPQCYLLCRPQRLCLAAVAARPAALADFTSGVRGKYARRYAQGTNVVVLEPDVTKAFPNAEAVNSSLRALAVII